MPHVACSMLIHFVCCEIFVSFYTPARCLTTMIANNLDSSKLLPSTPKLILMRHGESVWNKQNLFTAWVDIPLSNHGIQEAIDAGKTFSHIPVDVVFTSQLIRAKITSMLCMTGHASGKTPVAIHAGDEPALSAVNDAGTLGWYDMGVAVESSSTNPIRSDIIIPVRCAWQLNERCYGELQGLNKDDCIQKWGAEQVRIWRRSYNVPPPQGESLQMTAKRAVPYFTAQILPYLLKNRQNVLIVAHGSSLRAVVLYLQGKLDEQGNGELEGDFVDLEFENGKPLCYLVLGGDEEKEKFVECSIDIVQAAHM